MMSRGQNSSILIHSGWRTGGTYLWQKFRALSEVHAYSEPFHQILREGSMDALLSANPRTWRSGHGSSDTPYFREYSELHSAIGGRGYQT